jgi:uncharacterized membrane protein YccC
MLALALAPVLIACGLLMTQPRTGLLGLGLGVVGFTLLALQDTYTGNFAQFANSVIAVIAGVWIAAIVTRLMRSVAPPGARATCGGSIAGASPMQPRGMAPRTGSSSRPSCSTGSA